MRQITIAGLFALLALALSGSEAAANLLANPSFEDPITSDGAPFVGSWEGFDADGDGPTADVMNSSAMPRTGAQHVAISINNADNSFAGVFQDVPNLVPGTTGIFSGWHKTTTSPLDAGVELRIEWRNSGTNTEVSRTPNATPVPGGEYSPFSLSALVPAGADTARVVYAIQTFGPEPTNNGTVFIDDLSFVVPEPSSLALLAFGSWALVAVRRRAVNP